jgi:hypothetical protein
MIRKIKYWYYLILWVTCIILSVTLIIPFSYWVFTGWTWFTLLAEIEYKLNLYKEVNY